MKIVIDGRFWGPGHTGLGVYTKELVENLSRVDKINSYILFLRPEAVSGVSLPKNFHIVVVDASAYSLKEQILLPWCIYRLMPDLVHFPSINVPLLYFGKYVVTVHDLIKHQFRGPETSTRAPILYWSKQLIYLFVSWWAVKMSKKIIVPSMTVRDQLQKVYKLPQNKIVVTYEASTVDPEKEEKAEIFWEKFVVYAGNAYPHKNIKRLINAWRKVFEQTKTHLVIVCGRSVFTARFLNMIKKSQADKYVHFVGYLSQQQLAFVYKRAKGYVFPTLAEGFGIPGLDAMHFGLPVVCSDLPVLREIYGQAALYFDPQNENDMTEKICRILTDRKLAASLIKEGKIQVAKYSWQKTAKITLSTYESCFSL